MSERELDYATGILSLTDAQERYLEWLCGERAEGQSHAAFAEELGYAESTLYRWRKDKSFLRLWEDRMREGAANPLTLSKQLEVLNAKALAGDVKAIELYWKLVDRMTPDRLELTGAESTSDLSDAELAAKLRDAAGQMAERAKPESPKEQADRVRGELGLRVV